jgi:quinol monooxygenase YgiN
MIFITLRLVARPAADHTLLRPVKDPLLEPTRAEPGCLRAHQSPFDEVKHA